MSDKLSIVQKIIQLHKQKEDTLLLFLLFNNAIVRRSLPEVKFCISQGANINVFHKILSTLGAAVIAGNIEILKYLINNGAYVHIIDRTGYNPFTLCGRARYSRSGYEFI